MHIKQLTIAFICLLAPIASKAQHSGSGLVAQDPELRTGTLSNGMTYYIRHSNTLPGHADFHIFHAVGAIQEEDNQNGLAHFLEHVAFKGLKHLPGNELLDYMERNGVKFGPNLNASTSFDYTRYMLRQVPVNRQGMVDTCLLVLADWSGSILATQEAIDFERGVIREEYRSRSNLENRINIAMQPFYFQGSKYACRTVIGDMDIINHFSRKELLDFYHTWYRPDQQAIAIVGDIDAVAMEQTVRERFSALPEAAQPQPKTVYPLPGNTKPIYAVYRDAEVAEPSISLLYKHPQPADADRPTVAVYTRQYLDQALIRMMNLRWQDLSEQDSNPLKQLSFSYGEFMADQDVFAVSGDFKADKAQWTAGLDQLLQEAQRFRKLGFQETELKRVKAYLYKQLERQKLEAGKPSTNALVDACLDNFLHHEPIPSAETRYRLLKHALDTLSLDYANRRMPQFFGQDNQIVGVVTSKADSIAMPNKDQILAGLNHMGQLQVSPYYLADAPVLQPAHPPKKGKVVKSAPSVFGATEWTLRNGAKVLILPTTHKKDEVLLMASNPGGRSVISDADLPSSYMLISQLMNAGVGTLNATALKQALSGHIVYATPYLSEYDEGIGCSASPSDLETLFKLVYMYYTEARFDAAVLHRDLQQYAAGMEARKLNPMAALQDSVMQARFDHHPRSLVYLKDTAAVQLERIKKLYREHFANPADFKWVIAGNTDLKTLKPLVETYIGGFPDQHREDHWRDLGKRSPQGQRVVDFTHPMETPKSITFMEYTAASPFSLQKLAALRLLKDILDIRFKVLLRDDKSGVYSTDGEGSFSELPIDKMQLIVSFQSDPTRMDELSKVVMDELQRLSKEGIATEDLQKSKEYLKKAQQSQTESNYYWQSVLYSYASSGRDKHSGMAAAIDAVTTEDIRQLLAGLLAADNLVHVTMRPETTEKGTIIP